MTRTLPPNARILSASFFWRNDKPGGLGFTFDRSMCTSEELTAIFTGEGVRKYMADSDRALGTNVVQDYLAQLEAIAKMPNPTLMQCMLAAFNIMWLAERGFIPIDEFNGPMFVLAEGDLP